MVFLPFAFESFMARRQTLSPRQFIEMGTVGSKHPSQGLSGQTAPPMRNSNIETLFLAVVHQHADSVLALRIVFSICLVIVFCAGLYILRIRKRLFDRDPEVTGDHYGARNLRLWQVILIWILAMDLLIMALWKV
jgi:hypothetical protein